MCSRQQTQSRERVRSRRTVLALLGAGIVAGGGCWFGGGREVVVYTALDAEFSEPILDDFQRETGIRVQDKFDVESVKTVGLVNEILHEGNLPRCDVFWNNEILHTLRLEEKGLLQVYRSDAAAGFPAWSKSSTGAWYGLAARARILAVNTERVEATERPDSILDLVDPKWKGRVAIAKPLAGTTATHAAVLFAHWGDDRARQYFRQLKENAVVMGGNKQVAEAVAAGQVDFGITDTDDAIIELEQGFPLQIIVPDQGPQQMGALRIPNTICVIRDAPRAAEARQLIDYLLSPAVEKRLAEGRSAQFPLNAAVSVRSRALPDRELRWMDADFRAAAQKWDEVIRFLGDLFARSS